MTPAKQMAEAKGKITECPEGEDFVVSLFISVLCLGGELGTPVRLSCWIAVLEPWFHL